MTKWLGIISFVVILIALSLTTRWWLGPLLAFLGANGDLIQSLPNAIQIVLWVVALIAIVFGWRRQRPPEAVTTTTDEANSANLLQEYLTTVITAYDKARLYGLESLRTTRDRPVRSLAEVFVPITLRQVSPPTRCQIEEAARKFGADPLAEHKAYLQVADELRSEGQPIALPDLLTLHPRLAIIGGAGCGKSTLLAYLAALTTEVVTTSRAWVL